jgi:uncharacterized protein YciI
MPYIAICTDDPAVDGASLRASQLQAHFAYIESILDRLLVAGPAGGTSNSDFGRSIFIYATDEYAEAEQLLRGDPYYQCKLYGDVRLEAFTAAAGRWIGGKTW